MNYDNVITVATMDEAISKAFKLSSEHPVLICDNIYESDKDFNGIILHVKGECYEKGV